MTETTLKQQARRFAQEHSVSYTRALAAVDEPLHRLKAELTAIAPFRRPGFRLTDSAEELLEPVAPDHNSFDASFSRRIRGTDATPYASSPRKNTELFLELARRTEILRSSQAADIWEHRRLYRAGLATEELDLVPSYYLYFRRPQQLLRDWDGDRLGFFEVAVLQRSEQLREETSERFQTPVSISFEKSSRLKKTTLAELQMLLNPQG